MPVVTVYLDAQFPVRTTLLALTACLAEALELNPDAVHAMHIPVGEAVTGTQSVAAWPTALLHGSRRSDESMNAALEAVRRVLAHQCRVARNDIWVQWVLTT